MNAVQLIGRITKDVDLRYTKTEQKPFCRFTLAVNRMRKDDGADFIGCVAWGKTAENMSLYVSQGDQLAITGRIQTGSYERDGHKIYTTEVICSSVEFLRKKGGQDQKTEINTKSPDDFIDVPEGIEDELPF